MHSSFFAPPPANASAGAAGAVGSSPGEALAPYVRQLCPAWERQLCDARASALLPELDSVGVGLELALVRPDARHHDRRTLLAHRVLLGGPAHAAGVRSPAAARPRARHGRLHPHGSAGLVAPRAG